MTISITQDDLRYFHQHGHLPPGVEQPAPSQQAVIVARNAPAPPPPRHVQGVMNATEAGWALVLESWRQGGEITAWQFEPLKLRLAKSTYYEPDFLVVTSAGAFELHEVKGFWRDDARVKVKVAADKFPMFTFRAVSWKGGAWKFETF